MSYRLTIFNAVDALDDQPMLTVHTYQPHSPLIRLYIYRYALQTNIYQGINHELKQWLKMLAF